MRSPYAYPYARQGILDARVGPDVHANALRVLGRVRIAFAIESDHAGRTGETPDHRRADQSAAPRDDDNWLLLAHDHLSGRACECRATHNPSAPPGQTGEPAATPGSKAFPGTSRAARMRAEAWPRRRPYLAQAMAGVSEWRRWCWFRTRASARCVAR